MRTVAASCDLTNVLGRVRVGPGLSEMTNSPDGTQKCWWPRPGRACACMGVRVRAHRRVGAGPLAGLQPGVSEAAAERRGPSRAATCRSLGALLLQPPRALALGPAPSGAAGGGADDPGPVSLGRMGGIPAVNGRGERLLLHIGIIDILQSYRWVPPPLHTGLLGPHRSLWLLSPWARKGGIRFHLPGCLRDEARTHVKWSSGLVWGVWGAWGVASWSSPVC